MDAPIALHLRCYEVTLSQKDIPQGMKIPEAFSSELCRRPSYDLKRKSPRQKLSWPGWEARSLTKNVLKSGIVFKGVVRHFPILLSFPEERVEAVVWVHGDVEMWAKCARCTRCLACFWGASIGVLYRRTFPSARRAFEVRIRREDNIRRCRTQMSLGLCIQSRSRCD
jgi:hypothetical protein